MRIPSVVAAGIRHVRVVRTGWTLDCWHWAVEKCKVSSGFKKWIPFSHLSQILYELEKKSSLVTRALSAKSCTRDTDSLHSCTRLRLVQEMACLYHECKILPRKHSYPNLIPIRELMCWCTCIHFFYGDMPNICMHLSYGLNIFYSWQNMTKDWAKQKMVSPLQNHLSYRHRVNALKCV